MKSHQRPGRPPRVKFLFNPEGGYDNKVPTFESVVGHEFGERITTHGQMEQFVQALAAASSRVSVVEYGQSYEGRSLYYLVVTSPDNHRTIDDICENISRLADPRRLEDEDELERIIATNPSIVLVEANVHGGEHSSMEAALAVAYHLAAARDAEVEQWLSELVILIDPVQNPDGHERSVNWYYSAFGVRPNPDANAAEHAEPWPGGRSNHYLFDLNRDWFALTQRESAARVQQYLRWNPQVVIDLHEMGSNTTFFFAPPSAPVNAHTPETVTRWWEVYGRAIARAFDRRGFAYFTREVFDSFFPGYGESWPTFHGATGMTFEQAAVRGIQIRRDDDSVLTFEHAIEQHFVATLATLEAAGGTRGERLRDFYDFNRGAIDDGRRGPVREWLVVPGERAAEAWALADLLRQQGVEVRRATEPFTHTARPLLADEAQYDFFPKDTLIIRLDQPKKRLIQALFEKSPEIDPEFLKEELDRDRNRRPDRIYDVTCWSLPLMFGLDAWCAETFNDAPAEPVGDEADPGRVTGEGDYAHLLPWTSNAAVRGLVELSRAGLPARVAREPFAQGEATFERGTILVPPGDSSAERQETIERIAAETGAVFVRTATGWQDKGISLGSMEMKPLKKPGVAVLYDLPVSTLSCGWLMYTLEQVYQLPFTALRWDKLLDGDLKDYDVFVLPSGDPDRYGRLIGEKELKRLKEWTANGGSLVALGGAAAFLAKEEHGLTTCRLIKDLRELPNGDPKGAKDRKDKDAKEKKGAKDREAKDKDPKDTKEEKDAKDIKGSKNDEPVPLEFRPKAVAGAVLRTRLDPYHFLAYGYPDEINVPITTDLILTPSQHGWNVATFVEKERLCAAGFLWEKMAQALPGQVYLVDEPHEKGHVILFADDPNFRATWISLNRLLLNALLFSPSLKR